MSGLLDDIPITNRERDRAWEAMIKRKDAHRLIIEDFDFPFGGSYHVWCIAWNKAWDSGFKAGWEAREEHEESKG